MDGSGATTDLLASGGIDASNGAAHSPALDLAAPFNYVFVFVLAALIAMIFIRGKAVDTSTIR